MTPLARLIAFLDGAHDLRLEASEPVHPAGHTVGRTLQLCEVQLRELKQELGDRDRDVDPVDGTPDDCNCGARFPAEAWGHRQTCPVFGWADLEPWPAETPIAHRDLKPENVDAGTPRHMSPEQEIAHLRRQVTELQTAMTAMVEAQPHRRVAAFFGVAGQHLPGGPPRVPDEATVRFRLALIAEEFAELLESSLRGQWEYASWGLDALDELEALLSRIFEQGRFRPDCVDLPAFVDALADIDYVVEGARLAFGVYGPPIATAVHQANMAKLGGPKRADGKIEKPVGWVAPDIAGLLREQGWKPEQPPALPAETGRETLGDEPAFHGGIDR